MNDALMIIIVFVILAVAVYLSVPRQQKLHSEPRSIQLQKTNMEQSDKDRIVREAYEANERAHKQNHADKCQALAELAHMLSRNPINYVDSVPALPCGHVPALQDGDIIDAEIVDPPGLPSGEVKIWTLHEIRDDWDRNKGG